MNTYKITIETFETTVTAFDSYEAEKNGLDEFYAKYPEMNGYFVDVEIEEIQGE